MEPDKKDIKDIYKYRDWFRLVIDDPSRIFEAMDWYRERRDEARELILPVQGKLLELNTYHAGYLALYITYFQQLKHLASLFEHRLTRVAAQITKEWKNHPPTLVAPKIQEIKILVEDDERYSDQKILLGEIELLRDEMDAIVTGFETRGWQIKGSIDLILKDLKDAMI